MLRNNPLINLFYSSFSRLPTPINISFFWNFSSCISFFLGIQIVTSIFLTMHYVSDTDMAFNSLCHIINEVNSSWLIRYMHMNSASFFLGLMYLHISRGIYYKRYSNKKAWFISVILFAVSMLTAFLSYVLPWSQMSFWSATVITNMISSIPMVSTKIVYWLWGSFSVSGPTLTRFYTFHFLFPMLIILLSILHLFFIHSLSSSSNPISFFSSMKIDFWPFFSIKDILSFLVMMFFFFFVVFFFSDMFSDPDNYIKANPMVTPVHIKPEWYFLFVYAMLRCIPNKLLSVLSLVFAVLIFFVLPFLVKELKLTTLYMFIFFFWVSNFVMLTWLSGCAVKDVYNYMSQICSFLYFFLLLFLCVIFKYKLI